MLQTTVILRILAFLFTSISTGFPVPIDVIEDGQYQASFIVEYRDYGNFVISPRAQGEQDELFSLEETAYEPPGFSYDSMFDSGDFDLATVFSEIDSIDAIPFTGTVVVTTGDGDTWTLSRTESNVYLNSELLASTYVAPLNPVEIQNY